MTRVYSINELVEFAIEIEKDGISFYKSLANKTEQALLKDLYTFLMQQELNHQVIYESLLANVKESSNQANYSDEYNQYMRALVESIIFNKKDPALKNLSDDALIIEYAIQKEKDSILFYKEMLEYVLDKDKKTVEKIIMEERMHIIKLLDMKEKLG
ncbi:MAG: ferritin family protein [Candidatus Margulisiibacteriota bacterium]